MVQMYVKKFFIYMIIMLKNYTIMNKYIFLFSYFFVKNSK